MTPKRMIASASLCLASLTACASPTPLTEIRVERVEIPAPLLRCAEEPPVPSSGGTWAEFFGYVIDLRAAGEDCRAKLGAIRLRNRAATPSALGARFGG